MTNCPYCGGEIPSTDFAVRMPGDSHFHFPCSDKALDEWVKLREENAKLREENDLQRDSIQKLSAQVAALREGLITLNDCNKYYIAKSVVSGYYVPAELMDKLNKLLAQPNPGADLLAKIERLEAVAKTSEKFYQQIVANTHTHSLDMSGFHGATIRIKQGERGKDYWQAMWAYMDAMAALEGGDKT